MEKKNIWNREASERVNVLAKFKSDEVHAPKMFQMTHLITEMRFLSWGKCFEHPVEKEWKPSLLPPCLDDYR